MNLINFIYLYLQGYSIEISQNRCDFIYKAASAMLCEDDRECVYEIKSFIYIDLTNFIYLYLQGYSLEISQKRCDFIYKAASAMLCEDDRECVYEADVFLNTMKLKHRYFPYNMGICR